MKTPGWLTQSNFPALWNIMQLTIGGAVDKARLYRQFSTDKRTILEIGCSTGNTAFAFTHLPQVEYVGLDIDPKVIAFAKNKFAGRPNFRFECMDAAEFSKTGKRFDLVLLAGVLHHVPDPAGVSIVRTCRELVAPAGTFVSVDPLKPNDESSRLIHAFMSTLEKGEFVRSDSEYRMLFKQAGVEVQRFAKTLIGATPLSVPKVSEFGSYTLS